MTIPVCCFATDWDCLHYAAKAQAAKAYTNAHDKGKSDAVKQQYWLYVSTRRQRNQIGTRCSCVSSGLTE